MSWYKNLLETKVNKRDRRSLIIKYTLIYFLIYYKKIVLDDPDQEQKDEGWVV